MENSMTGIIKNRINSVFVHVSDLKASAKWYSELLGLRVHSDRFNGGPVYWMELAGYTGLILDDNSINKTRDGWQRSSAPLYMYGADDVHEAYRRLREQGVTITLEIETPHEGLTFFNFQDPDGNVFMVCSADDNSPPLEKVDQSPVENRITAVFVHVKDMPKAAEWHFRLFGMERPEVGEKQTIVEIPAEKGADILLDSNRFLNGEDDNVLFMFETADIDEAFSFVKAKDIHVFSEIERTPSVSFFTVNDPDQNVVMICQSHELNNYK
ncbi:hypothetical protein SAMN05421736_11251 [Evansella caseinilytica]|uniref:VOC domain-containing protein n=1 Tax=Evansella caseinilytica TaxID=1503961 RepID=A0A1H3SVI0_9BACI|nr:VOC family protein [Evansella caseinilytica]SDZ41658.1 hypothetical protein SAMN05421736_11251 [Evansella caseinilytica]